VKVQTSDPLLQNEVNDLRAQPLEKTLGGSRGRSIEREGQLVYRPENDGMLTADRHNQMSRTVNGMR
jgi:hypothetical protein